MIYFEVKKNENNKLFIHSISGDIHNLDDSYYSNIFSIDNSKIIDTEDLRDCIEFWFVPSLRIIYGLYRRIETAYENKPGFRTYGIYDLIDSDPHTHTNYSTWIMQLQDLLEEDAPITSVHLLTISPFEEECSMVNLTDDYVEYCMNGEISNREHKILPLPEQFIPKESNE